MLANSVFGTILKRIVLVLELSIIVENFVLNASSADPYQTPCSAASDLILHYLQMSI